MGRKLDWDKAKWDSLKAGAQFVPSNDATEADIEEMDAVIQSRKERERAKADAALREKNAPEIAKRAAEIAKRKAKAQARKSKKTHAERLARWKAAGAPRARPKSN